MAKKIAVIVRDRQAEALRMSGGITLLDDTIEIFIPDRKLNMDDHEVAKHIEELIEPLEIKVYSNNKENKAEYLSLGGIAEKLLECDHILPY
ncbi:MAG: hypothetical protein AB1488_01830 [Nitrospirota bacterium]